jgi:hypothetical protein
MKKFCCAVFASLPLAVMAYPIEVEKQLNGAELSVTTQQVDHNMASIQLYNYGEIGAKCSAVFRSGPEAPRTRRTVVQAGQVSTLTLKSNRSIIKLRVKLTCEQE